MGRKIKETTRSERVIRKAIPMILIISDDSLIEKEYFFKF